MCINRNQFYILENFKLSRLLESQKVAILLHTVYRSVRMLAFKHICEMIQHDVYFEGFQQGSRYIPDR